jgi:hypothetical protein
MRPVPRIFWKLVFFVCYGNYGIFIPKYWFTIDTCCDTNYLILDNWKTFNLLLGKNKLFIVKRCSIPSTFNLMLIGNFIPTYLPGLVYNQYLNDPSHRMWNALIATQAIVSIDVLFSVKNKLWTFIYNAWMDIYFDLMTLSPFNFATTIRSVFCIMNLMTRVPNVS